MGEWGPVISIILGLQTAITGFWAVKTYNHERRLTVVETQCRERHRPGGK